MPTERRSRGCTCIGLLAVSVACGLLAGAALIGLTLTDSASALGPPDPSLDPIQRGLLSTYLIAAPRGARPARRGRSASDRSRDPAGRVGLRNPPASAGARDRRRGSLAARLPALPGSRPHDPGRPLQPERRHDPARAGAGTAACIRSGDRLHRAGGLAQRADRRGFGAGAGSFSRRSSSSTPLRLAPSPLLCPPSFPTRPGWRASCSRTPTI